MEILPCSTIVFLNTLYISSGNISTPCQFQISLVSFKKVLLLASFGFFWVFISVFEPKYIVVDNHVVNCSKQTHSFDIFWGKVLSAHVYNLFFYKFYFFIKSYCIHIAETFVRHGSFATDLALPKSPIGFKNALFPISVHTAALLPNTNTKASYLYRSAQIITFAGTNSLCFYETPQFL